MTRDSVPVSNRRLPTQAFLVTAVLVFSVMAGLLWSFTIDDTYISLRYAKNWADGNGLTWNKGESPIEGYTSILWVVLLAVSHYLSPHLVVAAKILSLASAVGLLVVCFFFAKRINELAGLSKPSLGAAASVMFLACWPPTAVHAVSGMETSFFALVLCSFLYFLTELVMQPAETRHGAAIPALLGLLLGLTRPEGNLVVIVGFLSVTALRRRPQRDIYRAVLLCYALPYLVYFVWRVYVYQHLLPLSFYIKVVDAGFLAGKADVARFLFSVVVPLGFLLALSAVSIPRFIIPSLISASSLVIFFLFPEHIMGYEHRFLYPVFPLAAVTASLGFSRFADWLEEVFNNLEMPPRKWLVVLLVTGLVVPLSFAREARDTIQFRLGYAYGLEAAHIRLGKTLSEAVEGDSSRFLLAAGDSGAIPYFSGWRAVDTYGLNDATIATTGTRDPGYVMSRQPDVVILSSQSDSRFVPFLSWESGLLAECERRNMVKVATLRFQQAYYLWVFGVRGSELTDKVGRMLQADCRTSETP